MKRTLKKVSVALLLLAIVLVVYVLFPWPMPPAPSFALVAHRGVHQTFPSAGLTNETCTARIIYPPAHDFIENTIPSMREAFAHGATAVELDIHRTADDQIVVFHDWTLDCRTNGTGVTNEQTLAYLQSLDVGHGYTADGGKTFPPRGTGFGMMKSLPEILATFPDKRFVIDDKDGSEATRRLLAEFLVTVPAEQRARISYSGGSQFAALHAVVPEVDPYLFNRREIEACLGDFLIRMLFTGTLPERCREQTIGIPAAMLPSIPG